MVANQPIERPGSSDYLVNLLNELRQQVDEQTRQSKFPFVVSHQDPLLGRVVDLQVVQRANNIGGASVQIFDGAGTMVLGTDPNVGYGLALPMTQVPMYQTTAGVLFVSAGSAQSYYTGQLQLYNSCFLAQWKFRVSSGGSTAPTGSTYVKIVDTVTGWNWTSPTVTQVDSVGAGDSIVTVGPFSAQIPQTSIGNIFTADIYTWVSANVGGGNGVLATPISMYGCSYSTASGFFAGTSSR